MKEHQEQVSDETLIYNLNKQVEQIWKENFILIAQLEDFDNLLKNKKSVENFGNQAARINQQTSRNIDNIRKIKSIITTKKIKVYSSEEFENWRLENEIKVFVQLIESKISNIFFKQIDLIKESEFEKFLTKMEEDQSQLEWAVYSGDQSFVNAAERATPPGGKLSYSKQRSSLQRMMVDITKRKKLVVAEKIKSGEQQAYSFQLLQQQQAQLHSIQQQQMGGAPTLWNVGIAYRPPDSIFNISAGYQQGKANIQVTMIPDEHASLLGATGFTAGVGPGNLGLSLNLNI